MAGPKGQWWEGEGLCHTLCDRDLVQGHTWPRATSGKGVGGLSPPRTLVVGPGQAPGNALWSPYTCLNKCVWMDIRPIDVPWVAGMGLHRPRCLESCFFLPLPTGH